MNRSDGQAVRESLYTIDEVIKIVSPIARRYDVRRLWLFGSYARGEATLDSDLDFRVEPAEPCDFFTYFGFISALEDAFDVKIDVISEDPSGDNYLDKKFMKQISHDEVLIYEHN
jgi:predicted nucleotidyltransferase